MARVESRGVRHASWRYYRDVLSLGRAPVEREADAACQAEAQLNAAVASLPPPTVRNHDRQPAHLDSAEKSLGSARRIPIAFGLSIVILLLSAIAAIIVPAHRVATVDPASVLKQV